MKITNIILILVLLFFYGCNKPSEDTVKKDFYEIYSNSNIISIGVGEGDSDNVYYHIKFKYYDNNRIYEEVFLYQNISGKWRKKGSDPDPK